MADKKIEFTISAVDKASATIARLNQNVEKMTRPYANLAKSIKGFSDVSGLTKVSKSLGSVANEAEKAARGILKIGAPLLAIVGGGTLAGLSEMVTHWERIGMETERTSRLLGITANQLTQLRSAGTLMGLSADTMTSGFQSLQDTLQDARWGRNQAAMMTLQALGIQLRTTKTGAIDTQAAMYDLADVIQRVQRRDPAAARNLARSLGVEQLMPVLMLGRKGMQQYEAEARRLRGDFTPEMAARATAFTQSITGMGLAFDGLKAAISDRLAPILGPMIDRFTNWIATNRQLISQRVGEVVERIANAFVRLVEGVDWDTFLDNIGSAAESISQMVEDLLKAINAVGGFKTVAIGLAVYMAGGFVSSMFTAVGSIVTLITRLGVLATSFGAVETAATAATAAAGAAGTATAVGAAGAGAAGAGAVGAGAAEAAAGGGGLLAGIASRLVGLINPVTAGVAAMFYSEGLNKGEDAQLKRIHAAEVEAGGKYPGSAPVAEWAKKLNFAGLEKQYGLPAGMLAGVAQTESHGNAAAMSPAGAKGLFQFMPATAKEYGINPFDPAASANAAAKKLSGLMERYHGNVGLALSAYNWGEGNVDRKGLAQAPAETLAYAPKVMAAMQNYRGGQDTGAPAPAPLPPLLNPAPPAMAQAAPPVVNVSTQVHVERDGRTSVRTETPNGLHVAYPMVANG
ncbi:lytic transglycosylase domain-containing protein [Paraburkholderia sp. 35.1]|uniref:lytic transglycosylase domain-containing protein n=1 Tax=Paraburkholderia sp. 35.1 TaxID=2991058 RepID=UPI003D21A292